MRYLSIWRTKNMTNLNQWIGEGNLSCDPELRYTTTDKPVTNFFIYVDDTFRTYENSTNTTTIKKQSSKIPVVAWAGKAEMISRKYQKGDRVRLVGKIKTRKVQKDDFSYNVFEVVVETISLIHRQSQQN